MLEGATTAFGPNGYSSNAQRFECLLLALRCVGRAFVTSTYRLIYGFVVLGLGRRRILHVGVTAHPTQEWVLEQIREAIRGRPNLRYLLRDRDAVYGKLFSEQIGTMEIKQVVTDSKCPWHNNP